MVKTQLLKDIFALLLDDKGEGFSQLREQLTYLEESVCDYTGMGIFARFNKLHGIENHKSILISQAITGLHISSPQLKNGGEAILFVVNGFIDYLELFSYDGVYPKSGLMEYLLKQNWQNSPGKEISSKRGL